ncbi:MAG: YidC/Oxa1 family membrane protein insertase [Candidatus Bipolaricaulota bacterium]
MIRVWAAITAAVVAVGCTAFPVAHPVRVEHLQLEGVPNTKVEDAFVRYRFSAKGGVLASAYLHFATLRDREADAVPGWENGDEFIDGASRPFELWVDGPATADAPYEATMVEETAERAVIELAGEGEGWSALKRFTVDHDALYSIGVQLEVRAPDSEVQLVLGHLDRGLDLLYMYDGQVDSSPQPAGAYVRFEGLGLVGNGQVFFLRLDRPAEAQPFKEVNDAGQLVFGLKWEEAPEELVLSGTLYAGRDRYLLLEKAGLEKLSPVGLFSRLLVVVMRFLGWLYELTGNYVWAILLFTLLTRVLLYPVMRTQLRSMAKMQQLQPKIKKLQERYKDDRTTMQQQMMELYRKEKVNPLGGCLPMLLQLPLLILLWQAIIYSSEQIRLSPGFLWITDLSGPDPYYILVIVTTGLMMLQQWLTQRRAAAAPTGGMQAMGWLFPLIMAILLFRWPAGLWMYWLFTTLFQVGQQWVVDREIAAEKGRDSAPEDDGEDEGD